MQVTASNPMVGLEGRSALLVRLGGALASHPQFFGEEARPGNMLGKSPYVLRRGRTSAPRVFITSSPLCHGSFFPSSSTLVPTALTPIVLCGSLPLHTRIGTHDSHLATCRASTLSHHSITPPLSTLPLCPPLSVMHVPTPTLALAKSNGKTNVNDLN